MKLDEYIEFLQNSYQTVYSLDLNFDVNQSFPVNLTIRNDEDETTKKIGRRQLKTETEKVIILKEATALHLAVAYNRPDITKLLIKEEGANQNLDCTLSKQKYERNLELKKGKWVPADYAGKHMITSQPGMRLTALELAEKLNHNGCADILANVNVEQISPVSSQSNWSPSFLPPPPNIQSESNSHEVSSSLTRRNSKGK